MSAVRMSVVQNTDEWLEARLDGITASEMAIITGNRPGLWNLWATKCRLIEVPVPDPATQELFDIGHALEPAIAEMYTRKTGEPLIRERHMLRHRTITWLYASLDRRRRRDRRPVELKYAPYRWDDVVEPVPPAVQDQVQTQALVDGADAVDVAVLRGGRVDIHTVEADRAYQENLLFLAEDFRQRVLTRTPPEVDGSDETRLTLQRMHPRDTLGLLDPSPESTALALAIRDAIRSRKDAESEEERVKNAMRVLLGDSAGVEDEGAGYRISWRKSADSERTDWKLVAQALRRVLEGDQGDLIERLLAAGMHPATQPELLDAIEALHTETREGPRVLRARFLDDDTGKWV